MSRTDLLAVGLAACCLLAIGTAATSLDAAVKTSPDEFIDSDTLPLPLGTDDAAELKRQIQGGTEPGEKTRSGGRGEQGGLTEKQVQTAAAEEGSSREAATAGGSEQQDAVPAPVTRQGVGAGIREPTLLDRVLGLLAALRAALPFVVAAGLLALAVAYRQRLAALVRALTDRYASQSTDAADASPVGEPAPANEIARAWFEMASRLGFEPDKTPREYAAAAIDAGSDPAAVRRLTDLFEEVRYGGAPVTDERTRRARESLQRVRGWRREGEP